MYWYEQILAPVVFNDEKYPQDAFWEAYNAASKDKNLKAEIVELEEKYIQKHLDIIMRRRELEKEEMRKMGLI